MPGKRGLIYLVCMNLALLALAVAFLSQPGTLIRWARAPIEVIGFWRLLIAAAALTPSAWMGRGSWLRLSAKERGLTALAGTLLFAHLWTFVYAAQHTRLASAVVLFSTHPLWTGAGAWLLFGEAVTARLGVAYVLAGLGVWTLVGGSVNIATVGSSGDIAALVSAAFFSGYVLAGRRLRRCLDNTVYAALLYWIVAFWFLAFGLLRGVAWTGYPSSTWLAILGLALGVTLCGHAIFTYLLGSMNVNLLSCAKLLEPIGAALGAWLVFGEPLMARTVGAFALISGGVLILILPGGRSFAPEPEALGDA